MQAAVVEAWVAPLGLTATDMAGYRGKKPWRDFTYADDDGEV